MRPATAPPQTRVVAVSAPAAEVDRTAPNITRLRFTPARFRVGARPTAQLARGPPHEATGETGPGRHGPAIDAQRARDTRRSRSAAAAACVRTLVRASERPGEVSIAFSGQIGGSALAPGAYSATVTAIDRPGTARPRGRSSSRSSRADVKYAARPQPSNVAGGPARDAVATTLAGGSVRLVSDCRLGPVVRSAGALAARDARKLPRGGGLSLPGGSSSRAAQRRPTAPPRSRPPAALSPTSRRPQKSTPKPPFRPPQPPEPLPRDPFATTHLLV